MEKRYSWGDPKRALKWTISGTPFSPILPILESGEKCIRIPSGAFWTRILDDRVLTHFGQKCQKCPKVIILGYFDPSN